MGLAQFLTSKLGLSVAGVLLALVVFVQVRDTHRQRTIRDLTQDLAVATALRDAHALSATGYEAIADTFAVAVRVLEKSIDEYSRLSDSVRVRSQLDLARAKRQSEEAETTIQNMREAFDRAPLLDECELFVPPSRLPSYW